MHSSRLENLSRDIQFGIHQLVKTPGFAVVTILVISFGIATSTVLFSIAEAVLVRPLPYKAPQQIVRIWERMSNGHLSNLAESNFEDFRTQNDTFANLAAYDDQVASVSGGSESARVNVSSVSKDFFQTLGIQPLRGRFFVADEQRPHGSAAVIVSYGYWQRYLGSSADLSGLHLDLNGGVYAIVGVMPPEFNYPLGVSAWIPRELDPPPPSRGAHNWRTIGRIKEGHDVAQARANLTLIADRIRHQYGSQASLSDTAVLLLAETIVGDVRTPLFALSGAVGLLILITCANVFGLIVARISGRQKELAIRVALGAGRDRLAQQLLAESFALSLAAGCVGALLAVAGVKMLPQVLPAGFPRQEEISFNFTVLLFGLILTATIGVVLGLLATWRANNISPQIALSAQSRGHSGSLASQRLRSFLVIGEIATAMVILIAAGLLGRSFLRLTAVNPGFRPDNLIMINFLPPGTQGTEGVDPVAISRQTQLLDNIVSRLSTVHGIASVGVGGSIPVAAGDNLSEGLFLVLNGNKPPADFKEFGQMAKTQSQTGSARYSIAGPQYFQTLGIPLKRGRAFGDQDALTSLHVAVISESLARLRWPDQDPLGQVIDFGNMDGNLKPLTIVGIVGDVRARGLDHPPSPIIYVNYRQRGLNPDATPTIMVRATDPMGSIVPAARIIFHELAPNVPVTFNTFEQVLNTWLADRRLLLFLIGLFACAALLLASVGLYGVVVVFVALRTKEFGIRIAIGAQRSDVLMLVLQQGARTAAAGVLVGILLSLGLTRVISSLLFGITSADPITFLSITLLVAVIAIIASFIPAFIATRTDPVRTLRYE